VLHRCDVPLCVNPSHLFLGTKAENNADMKAKGRNRYKLPAPATGDAHPLYRQPMKAPRRKLTWDAVESIRVAHISGDSTQSIAERYGITREQVNNIVSERQWKVSV
jgi:predicted DNA-binding protein (UPF0251 family)